VLVVVGSALDTRARNIVAHWGARCAALLSVEDLSKAGWVFAAPPSGSDWAVIGGELVRPCWITGILTLRARIYPEELPHVAPRDRSYIAAELNAFLLAWLAAQPCPVLNRPTPLCLAGPGWRPEQWAHTAARHSGAGGSGEVTVAGERCFGSSDRGLQDRTLELARAAGVDLLTAAWENGRLRFASPWPALDSPAVLEAVRARLEGHP